MHVPLLSGDMLGSASSSLAPATPGRRWHTRDAPPASSAYGSAHGTATLGKVMVWWSGERVRGNLSAVWDADPTEISVGPFI